jgi:hypothetical protein
LLLDWLPDWLLLPLLLSQEQQLLMTWPELPQQLQLRLRQQQQQQQLVKTLQPL